MPGGCDEPLELRESVSCWLVADGPLCELRGLPSIFLLPLFLPLCTGLAFSPITSSRSVMCSLLPFSSAFVLFSLSPCSGSICVVGVCNPWAPVSPCHSAFSPPPCNGSYYALGAAVTALMVSQSTTVCLISDVAGCYWSWEMRGVLWLPA